MNTKKKLSFSSRLVLTVCLLVLVSIAFAIYALAEKGIDRANEQRYRTMLLVHELRQSSDDLTRMVRTYVATGNPTYKKYYQDILDIREGRLTRPAGYQNIYWDFVFPGQLPPRTESGQRIALMDMMHRSGFNEAELRKLAEAKANSDRLMATELAAMQLVDSAAPGEAAKLEEARRILYDYPYHQAKAEIMRPLHALNDMLDKRTQDAVLAAEARATQLRIVFIVFGIAVLYVLWRNHVTAHRLLGAPPDEVHAQIVRLGLGDFSSDDLPPVSLKDSVLGWLAETRQQLSHADAARRQAENKLDQRSRELLLHNWMLQRISLGLPLAEVFDQLVRHIEADYPGVICSIMLLDEDGKHLRHGAAPSLPDAYNRAVDGVAIGEATGSCGTAAFLGERVIVEDIRQHPYWLNYRDFALLAGVRSCWSQPFKDRNGRVLGTFAIYHREPNTPSAAEISLIEGYASLAKIAAERARTEAALLKSQALYRLIADNSSDVIWLMELHSQKFVYVSPSIVRLRGWTAEEVMAQSLAEVMTPESLARVNVVLRDALQRLANGDPAARSAIIEIDQPCKDGRIITTEVVCTLLPDEAGQAPRVLGVTRDITERKQAEVELEQYRHHLERMVEERTLALSAAKEAAEAASQAKSTFLANMSHELRTPMNAIMGMTDLALHRATDPRQRVQLGKVGQASQHLLAVINDILDISKIEAQRLKLESTPFRLGGVLENLRSMTAQRAVEKGLQLRIELDQGLSALPLLGDPVRLGQVLLNLTGNALKFTDTGSITVRVTRLETSEENVRLRFEVQDTGIGIAPADQARLFTAFEQADGSMNRRYGGTGLGLAISKRLVAMMGGSMGVVSGEGAGSCFWFTACFTINYRSMDAVPSRPAVPPEIQLQSLCAGGRRILLVEDEPVNQEVSRELLERAGLLVDLAVDGRQAVELAGKNDYDLILMDVQMPNMNGIDATRAIRAQPGRERLPILALTANAFDEDRQRCFAAGMNDHIGKPVDPNQLFATLYKWLAPAG